MADHAETGHADTAGNADTADYASEAGSFPAGITGSGTADYIPKFTNSKTLGDSVIYNSGSDVGTGRRVPGQSWMWMVT